jgi:hypothetical protein
MSQNRTLTSHPPQVRIFSSDICDWCYSLDVRDQCRAHTKQHILLQVTIIFYI